MADSLSVCKCVYVCVRESVCLRACVKMQGEKSLNLFSDERLRRGCLCIRRTHSPKVLPGERSSKKVCGALLACLCLANVSPITPGVIGCHRGKQCMNSIKVIYMFQGAQQIDFEYIILLLKDRIESQIDKLFCNCY